MSLNLARGSALASIGLTIPCVATDNIAYDMKIVLGLAIKSTILLGLSVFYFLDYLSIVSRLADGCKCVLSLQPLSQRLFRVIPNLEV
jgi:hypothetical protein